LVFVAFPRVGTRADVILGGTARKLAQRKHESATVNPPCVNTNADTISQNEAKTASYSSSSHVGTRENVLLGGAAGQQTELEPHRISMCRDGWPCLRLGCSVFFSFLTSCTYTTQAELFSFLFAFFCVGARENVLLGGAARQLAQQKRNFASVNPPCGNTNADAISQNEAKPSSYSTASHVGARADVLFGGATRKLAQRKRNFAPVRCKGGSRLRPIRPRIAACGHIGGKGAKMICSPCVCVCVRSLPLETRPPPPPPPHTTNSSGTLRSADTQSAGPANTGPKRTAIEDAG